MAMPTMGDRDWFPNSIGARAAIRLALGTRQPLTNVVANQNGGRMSNFNVI
jgi:hypothetical protein